MLTSLLAVVLLAHGILDVRDFGAKGDGRTKDTAAIQAAIDAAERRGGATVVVPRGTYLCGTLALADNLDLHLLDGAEIKGSPDRADYNAPDAFPQNSTNAQESSFGAHLILCVEKRNVTVRGPGRINGNAPAFLLHPGLGEIYWRNSIPWRPSQMLCFVESENVRLESLTLTGSPYWSCFIHGCTNVVAKDLEIDTTRKTPYTFNGDGLDIDSSQHVRVTGCRISSADDAFTVRANGRRLKHPRDCSDVVVSNCVFSSATAGIRLGVGEGRIHDVSFRDIAITNSLSAVVFTASWSPKSRGTDIRGVRFENLAVDAVQFLDLSPGCSDVAVISDVEFWCVTGRTQVTSAVRGAKGRPVNGLRFRDVDVGHGVGSEDAARKGVLEAAKWRMWNMHPEPIRLALTLEASASEAAPRILAEGGEPQDGRGVRVRTDESGRLVVEYARIKLPVSGQWMGDGRRHEVVVTVIPRWWMEIIVDGEVVAKTRVPES